MLRCHFLTLKKQIIDLIIKTINKPMPYTPNIAIARINTGSTKIYSNP